MKNNRIFFMLFLITTIIFVSFSFVVLDTFYPKHIKYATDYKAYHIVKARNIILSDSIPTEEELEKYDINDDGKINDADIELMRHMILELYDCYEVRDGRRKAIKYMNE